MINLVNKITTPEGAVNEKNLLFQSFEIDLIPKGSISEDTLEELDLDLEGKVTLYKNPLGVHGYISDTGAYFNFPALPSLDIPTLSPEEVMMHRIYLIMTIKLIMLGLDKTVSEDILDEVIEYDMFNEMQPTTVEVGEYVVKTTPANSFIHMYIFPNS